MFNLKFKIQNLKWCCLFILACCLLPTTSRAQQTIDQTFRPIISAGMVASQVDGDTYGGYSKIGYFLGLGINRQFSRLLELEFALTLIQKGARHNYALDSASRNNPNNPFFLSRLTYLEVPLVLKFNYKKFKAEVGGAAGYLIKNPPYISTNNPTYPDAGYRNFDFSYIIGAGYKINPNLLINLRFEYSIVTIHPYYTSSAGIFHGTFPFSLFNRGLYNNLLQLTLNYRLHSNVVTATAPTTPSNGQ